MNHPEFALFSDLSVVGHSIHKPLGIAILALALVRLALRLRYGGTVAAG